MEFPHIDVVKDYLKKTFPGLEIEYDDDFTFHAHTFKVIDGDRSYILKVSTDYANDTDAESFTKLLDEEGVDAHMRNGEYSSVMISNDGMLIKRK